MNHSNNNGDIAFRLPALNPKYLDKPQEVKQCPRETRVIAAFENALEKKKNERFLKPPKKVHLKLHEQIDGIEAEDTKLFLNRLLDAELRTLDSSADVVGYLVREVTEVSEAIEKSKDRLRNETIQGLWKLIAGVFHSMGQENLKKALVLKSPVFRYENYSKALPLSPRFFRKLEKREPVVNTPQVCKGCQVGGPLPWLYLYPDREIYRTGGGFDCIEFPLPLIKSDKHPTIPKNPFSQSRGKLIETRAHRLPAKRKASATKSRLLKFRRRSKHSEVSVKLPHVGQSLSGTSESDRSSIAASTSLESFLFHSKNGPQLSPLSKGSEHNSNRMGEDKLVASAEKNARSEKLYSSSSQQKKNSVTFDKNIKERIFNEIADNNNDKFGSSNHQSTDPRARPNPQSMLNSLSRTVSNLGQRSNELGQRPNELGQRPNELGQRPNESLTEKSVEIGESEWTRRFKAKISVSNSAKQQNLNAVHNSTLLIDKGSANMRNFEGRKVSNVKFGGFVRKKKTSEVFGKPTQSVSAMNGTVRSKRESISTATMSDLSMRFSSSLSMNYPESEATDILGLNEFSLTGAKVKPASRKPSMATEKYNPPGYRKRSMYADSMDGKGMGAKGKNRNGRRRKSKKSTGNSDLGTSVTSSVRRDSSNGNLSLTSGVASDTVTGQEGIDEVDTLSSEKSIKEEEENEWIDLDDEDLDDFMSDDEFEFDSTTGTKKRRRAKRRRTLQYRTEPLSKYTLRRGSRSESQIFTAGDEDLSMLDYAARYCIISLDRLSKYENIFNSYASCESQANEDAMKGSKLDSDIVGETQKQKALLKDYEKLVYGMDIYQQRISEADKKKVEMIRQQQGTMDSFSNASYDEEQKKLLEASIQALSPKIDAVENRIKQFLAKLKQMMEKKRELQDALRESGMESEKIEKLIKNTDFLERRFQKMKNQQIDIESLPTALRIVNKNFNNEDFKFVTRILQLPKNESLDFKAFAIVAALSERIGSLDKSIKALLREVDLGTLERKLDKCKELYRLLAEENSENGKKLVPVENLAVELQAGGLEEDHKKSVINKLDHQGQGFVDFLDFVLYVPLFLMIHDQIFDIQFTIPLSVVRLEVWRCVCS